MHVPRVLEELAGLVDGRLGAPGAALRERVALVFLVDVVFLSVAGVATGAAAAPAAPAPAPAPAAAPAPAPAPKPAEDPLKFELEDSDGEK